MRRAALVAAVLATSPLLAWACGGDSTPSNAGPDASSDAPSDAAFSDAVITPQDASVSKCKLSDGADPIFFCLQKSILSSQTDAVFAAGVGTYASWNSTSLEPDKGDGGQFVHDVHDDLAFAAALASYQTSALVYGDNSMQTRFDALLVKLEAILEAEMSPLPAEYGGDVYRELRLIAGGLRLGAHAAEAARIDAIAESYGRAILTYARPVATLDAGSDSGSEAGADAATDAAGDAASEGGADGGASSDGVLGVPTGAGQVAYAPVDVVTGAFALLDMAQRHLVDDAAFAASAQGAALRSLDHVWSRARDATTGMVYASLVTSGDPGHDTLAPPTSAQPSDALLLEVQASMALTLSRAQELASSPNSGLSLAVTAYPFAAHASALVDACNGPAISLWDGPENADAGTGGGYIEGYVPSTATLLTNKPSRGNAFMYAAIHRLLADVGGNYPWQGRFLRPVLTTPPPPLNAGLYSVVTGQVAYFRAASRDFHLALQSPAGDGGSDGGAIEPRAASYTSRASDGVCEAFTELWYNFHM